MKRKVFVIILMFTIILLFCSGITYSMFNSKAHIMTNQNIAKFVFNAEKTDAFELPLVDLLPGDTKEYNFAVSNNYEGKMSDVVIKYQLTIKTMHFMPLTIKLYKLGTTEELVLDCNEQTYSARNLDNEIVCNALEQEMSYNSLIQDEYKIEVTFPSEYNTEEYSGLVDYIDMEIKSFQKLE